MGDLAQLRQEIERQGLLVKRPGRILLELVFHVTVALGGFALCIFAAAWPLKLLGLLIATAASMGVATNTHTATHGGTSDSDAVNEGLALFGLPFFLGLSARYWHFSHVVRHHPAPNVQGVDGDSDLSPWFALNQQQMEGGGALRGFYYRHLQWLVFPLILSVNAPQFQLAGWRYLVRKLRDPQERSLLHWLDLMCLFAHWTAWVVVPLMFFAPADVLLFTAARMALLGHGMFLVLAPGHYPAEAIAVARGHGELDHFRRQCETSLNFRAGIGGIFVSGLDYQIEHHLFPKLSHPNYKKLSPLVRRYCEEHGYPHQTLGWAEAVWKSLLVFRRPKPVQQRFATAPDLEAERQAG